MILFFPNLFDQLRCEQLNRIAIDYNDRKSLSYEGGDYHYGNSFGTARIPEFEKLLHEMTPMIKSRTGYQNIAVENSYTRIYFNGSDLKKHVDRVGLDITLSVCTYSDVDVSWPLFVEKDGAVHTIETKPGDGALILGTQYAHWRSKLVVPEGRKVIQSFYHWKFINV
jgi:hypothetical protein